MLQYWRLNKNKWLGMAISWFFLFSVFTLVVLLRANLTMQILLINIAVSAGVVFLSFLLLLIYGFSGFRRKSLLFNSQPFDHLKSAGFNEELTASQHKFFFADKRLAGFIDGYRVKIDGDGKKLTIFVGTDAFPDPLVDSLLVKKLKQMNISLNEIFAEKIIWRRELNPETNLFDISKELVKVLRQNGIQPR